MDRNNDGIVTASETMTPSSPVLGMAGTAAFLGASQAVRQGTDPVAGAVRGVNNAALGAGWIAMWVLGIGVFAQMWSWIGMEGPMTFLTGFSCAYGVWAWKRERGLWIAIGVFLAVAAVVLQLMGRL